MSAADEYRRRHAGCFVADDVTALRDRPNEPIREFLVKATRPRDKLTVHFLVTPGRIASWRPPEADLVCAQPYIVNERRDARISDSFAADVLRRVHKGEAIR